MHCFCNRMNNLCGGHSLAFRSKILLQRRYLAGLEQYILLRNSLFAFSTKHAASFILDNLQQWRHIKFKTGRTVSLREKESTNGTGKNTVG